MAINHIRAVKHYKCTIIKIAFFGLFILAITACTSSPRHDGKPLAQITFAHLQPIEISAETISLNVPFTISSPAVSYFNPSPSKVIEDYLSSRIISNKQTNAGSLNVIITTLNIQEKRLPSRQSQAQQFFKRDDSLLSIKIDMKLEYASPTGTQKSTTLSASRETMLADDMTIAQREITAQNLIRALISDIDPVLVRQIESLTL